MEFRLHSPYQPTGDQPQAIEQLVAGPAQGGERHQVLLGATGTGKTFTMANVIGAGPAPDAGHRAQQDAGRAALRRVPGVLPRQRGRVLRLLLRLLPARGLRPAHDLYIEKETRDQRGDRPAAPGGDTVAALAARRAHRRLGLVHLRPGHPGRLRQGGDQRSKRGEACAARSAAAPAGGDPLRAQRPRARAAARSACAATRWRSCRPTARPAYRVEFFGDEVERIDRDRPADRRDPGRAASRSRSTRPSTSSPPEEKLRRGDRGHRGRAGGAAQLFQGAGQAAGGAAPRAAHALRPGDAARGGLLHRHRELLAPPRPPRRRARRPGRCWTTSRRTTCWSSTRAT